MEDQRLLEDVFRRYLKNECTAQEVKFLLNHFNVGNNEEALRGLIAKGLSDYPAIDNGGTPQMHRSLDNVFDNIMNEIDQHEAVNEDKEERKNRRPLLLRLSVALMLAFVVFRVVTIDKQATPQSEQFVRHAVKKQPTQIKPGGNKAILTLQDGSTVVLDDAANGTVAQQGGANVVKTANGQLVYNNTGSNQKVLYNTMSTPRGGQFKLTLPDGTDVWLNSASSITYPTAFVGKERKVSITGEAYFEVAKDKARPFHVKAGAQDIEVLGTHFNVMAYDDEDAIKTTLVEGSVKVSTQQTSEILKPGEQSVNKGGRFTIAPAAIDEALAWKNGYFKFNRVGIKAIMRQLARWYDVEVIYAGQIKEDEFVGTIGRAENITQALHLLELANVHFKIKDKTITVLPY